MRIAASSVCLFLLCGCLTQSPAPVSMKGERFYGSTDSDEHLEYRLTRDNSTPTGRSTAKPGLILVEDASTSNMDPVVYEARPGCDFSMPLNGKVVSMQSFGNTGGVRCESGVAIISKGDIEVTASSRGKVMYVGKNLRKYGNLVILEHDRYTITMYYNLDEIGVKIGDSVNKGDVLATIASSYAGGKALSEGNTPFCCFSMRHDGREVDTVQHLKQCKLSQR
ncbi:peptidase [Anaplasma phagocytophilum str. MRK]|uniref:M23 family metallopeptidase n=1 Tax=Anaplasma phagocytophilum TaxID=948 RepID=UPI000533911D|nr:peptidoglycan DD-metalloendopeptidase family protein [Anaplasma phagocytophilum]KDB56550.1 peptidase [Anaplasma phagocytophilum str. MRK]